MLKRFLFFELRLLTKNTFMRTFLLLLSISFMASCANRAVYKSPDQDETTIRSIAVLPLKITQTGHRARTETEESIKKANDEWGYVFQSSLHSYLLKQTSRNNRGQLVAFQAIQKTNAILKEQNLAITDLYDRKPEDLAKLLGVDAVLMTTLDTDKNFSDNVAYGMKAGRILLGAAKSPVNVPSVNSSDINMNSYLYDANDSKLLWKTYRSGGADMPYNVDGQIEYFSNWIAKKLPYRS
jgi:hypothetical protein